MVKKFNHEINKVLKRKTNLISTFSTEMKLQILETAESGNVEVLKQQI
jgi:hypothetical protein